MKKAPLPGFAALPLETAERPRARSRLRTEEFGPPPGVSAFTIRLMYGGGRRREVAADRLTTGELQWVARTVLAVMEARLSPADGDVAAVQELESSWAG